MRDLLLGPVDLPGVRAFLRLRRHADDRLIGCRSLAASLGSTLGHVFRLVHGDTQVRAAYDKQDTLANFDITWNEKTRSSN